MQTDLHDHSHPHDHDHDHDGHSHFWDEVSARGAGGLWRGLGLIAALAVAVLLVYSVCFFVDETEYAYVTEFGKPVRLVVEPGLGFKAPYQSLLRLDRRLQLASPPGSQMLTRDRPRAGGEGVPVERQGASLGGPTLSIDWYACWRLPTRSSAGELGVDFEESVLRFVQSVGTISGAQDRLRERIDAMLKAKVGRMSLSDFVSLNPDDIQLDALAKELTEAVRRDAIDQFGIDVVDVRIKRFNHPEGVKPSIFSMIRAERQGVAEKYRAEGKSEAAKIRSQADTERAQILSKALADAERIRGEGDAEAMHIANQAHREDPQFYQLLKTLDTYRAILNDKTTIVLSSDSPLLKLLTEGLPERSNAPRVQPQLVQPGEPAKNPAAAAGNGKPEEDR